MLHILALDKEDPYEKVKNAVDSAEMFYWLMGQQADFVAASANGNGFPYWPEGAPARGDG